MTCILSLLGQRISLIPLVNGNDIYKPSLSLIMTTCLAMTGLGYQLERLSFPLHGLMPSLPWGGCCHESTWRGGLSPPSSVSCQG